MHPGCSEELWKVLRVAAGLLAVLEVRGAHHGPEGNSVREAPGSAEQRAGETRTHEASSQRHYFIFLRSRELRVLEGKPEPVGIGAKHNVRPHSLTDCEHRSGIIGRIGSPANLRPINAHRAESVLIEKLGGGRVEQVDLAY